MDSEQEVMVEIRGNCEFKVLQDFSLEARVEFFRAKVPAKVIALCTAFPDPTITLEINGNPITLKLSEYGVKTNHG